MKCSVYGGCYVTITGSGLPENENVTRISFGDAPCKISSITSTEVQCQISTATKVLYVDNSGIHPGGSSCAAGYDSVCLTTVAYTQVGRHVLPGMIVCVCWCQGHIQCLSLQCMDCLRIFVFGIIRLSPKIHSSSSLAFPTWSHHIHFSHHLFTKNIEAKCCTY